MIKVSVIDNRGMNFEAKFPTQEVADLWINAQIQSNSWGRQERWERPQFGSIEDGHTQTRTVEENGQTITEYFYPQEYTITTTDITQEYVKEQKENAIEQAQEKGKKIANALSLMLQDKLSKGDITIEQLSEFVESEEVKKVERYLDKGYLTLVVPIIEGKTFTLITQEEKDYFLSLLR